MKKEDLKCVDRSWCQLRGFSEEQKDSFVFVGEAEENKQEITVFWRQQMYN